ncbi:secondary thiamine-phosphate synthase enzyme YjbQ [bacterium]|nr:secondary thiamine-phosphate synthase enzyme YjbQ [bacterium]MBU1072138.1 secondary thiamine-phosphate synthase enzyme YjbQ [bacterium]MBU1675037.1 secondary thiamine-phosphate synthase enzyme YjbQ [bacterium]
MIEFEVKTGGRTDFVDITARVQASASDLGMADGALLVWVPHTTAAVTVNEGADPDVVRDLADALDRMVPWTADYRHAEGNAAAHVKSSLFGCDQVVPVVSGRLALGTWQTIWFCEFDGPRRRRVRVSALQADGRDG